MSLVVAVMEDGKVLQEQPLDDYVLVCGEHHELTYTQKSTNTVVLTIKRIGAGS